MEQSPSSELNGCSESPHIPYNGTRRFITVFKRAHHWSLIRNRCIQSIHSNPMSPRTIPILFFHQLLDLQVFSSLKVSLPNFECIFIIYKSAICPAYLTLICLFNLIIYDEDGELWISSLRTFLQSPVAPTFLDPNILLSTLFSNTLTLVLRSSLSMRNQVSHPYKRNSKINFFFTIFVEETVRGNTVNWLVGSILRI